MGVPPPIAAQSTDTTMSLRNALAGLVIAEALASWPGLQAMTKHSHIALRACTDDAIADGDRADVAADGTAALSSRQIVADSGLGRQYVDAGTAEALVLIRLAWWRRRVSVCLRGRQWIRSHC